jgi:heavy metal translocating P-type ATPase
LQEILLKIKTVIPFTTLLALALWILNELLGFNYQVGKILFVAIVFGLIPLTADILLALKNRHFGVDIIALISISGSLILGEYLAGATILLMLAGGEFLENYAMRRSRKELSNLIALAPRVALVRRGTKLEEVNINKVKIGDEIMVKPGETVPVDGTIIEGASSFDESTITGESIPLEKKVQDRVVSGVINKDAAIVIRATKNASDSKYQQIVKLVKTAEADKAPFVRLADKYSVWFTLITLIFAGVAWYISGDPVRALTVLVVATPCPLILATPIAFASGVSKAAGRGVIFKSGANIEQLATSKIMIFDKTGTLTQGKPEIVDIKIFDNRQQLSREEIILIASSLEQLSEHVLSSGFTKFAIKEKLEIIVPEMFSESFGEGVSGKIGSVNYKLGKLDYVTENFADMNIKEFHDAVDEALSEGQILVFLADQKNKQVLAQFTLSDSPRVGVKEELIKLRRSGIKTLLMLTGDKEVVAKRLSKEFGFEEYIAQCSPEEKMRKVLELKKANNYPVVMVGDGINDSPALATADVGIAFGILGSNATTDSGDIVVTTDEFNRISYSLSLSQNVLKIAKLGIFIGIGLSIVLMLFGTLGYFTPVRGALMQEVIDVLVILNALRVKVKA